MLTPENITIAAILAVLLGGAVWAIVRAKKKGQGCVGCPHSKECASRQTGCNSCCSGHQPPDDYKE